MPSTAAAPDRRTTIFAVLALLLVVGVRLSFIRHVSFCGVPDSCSYLSLAESLGSGHGFQAHFADDLQLQHVTLPATGIEYWHPGTSFFLLLARPLGEVTLRSSLFITIMAGLLTSLAAWRIAIRFSQDRGLAAMSVVLCFIFPAVWDSSLIADSGLFYAAAVAWFLALFTVRFQGYYADALALVCVCVAYLVRNDAAILFVPFVVVLVLRVRASRAESSRSQSSQSQPSRMQSRSAPGSSLPYCALLLAGFLLALAPMHLIDYHVLGSAFPGSASRVLYLNDLSDLSSYGSLVDRHSWLAVGAGRLVKLRLATLPLILYRIIFVVTGFGMIFVPLLFLRKRMDGARIDRARTELPELAGGVTFLAVVLTVYGLVLPAIGGFSALRSAFPLLPLAAVLILVGIRSSFPSRAASVLSATLIAYYLISGVMYGRRVVADLAKEGTRVRLYGDFLHAQGVDLRTARIIADDPDQLSVTTGYSSIQLPSNGAAAIAQLALDLHATHVLVDPSARDLSQSNLDGSLHPLNTVTMPNSTVLLLTLRSTD